MNKSHPIFATLATALAAGVLVGTSTLKLPQLQFGDQPKAATLEVKPKDLELSCPGAALRTGGTNGLKVGKLDRVGAATVNFRQTLTDEQELQSKLLGSPQLTILNIGQVAGQSAPTGLSLIAHDPAGSASQSSSLLAALQTQKLQSDSISGLLAATCQPAASEQWLIGAETTVGRESLLILQNSTNLDASADLELFAEGGQVQATGLNAISVPANDFTVVPLASFAPKAKTLAVHVVSKGGAISAWIQQKTTRGLTNGGADLITSQGPAANVQVLPGLFVRGSALATRLIASNPDYQDLTPALHVFVPGVTDATVTIQVISSNANVFGTVVKQTVQAGRINRIEIPGLSDGDYAVIVQSDQPVQAEAIFSRVVSGKTPDFAYIAPAPSISNDRSAVVPAQSVSRLSVVNPGNAAVTLKVEGAANATVKLEAFSALQLPLPAGKGFTISSDGAVAAALVVDEGGAVAVSQLLDYANEASQVSVLVR